MQHRYNLTAKESACVINHNLTYSSVGVVNTTGCVYCVAVTFKMTEQVEKRICIKFCLKLEHFSMETIRVIQKVIGSFVVTTLLLVPHVSCSLFVKHQITQVTQPACSPDLDPCDSWLFPKLKSPLKGKRFQTIDEIQEIMIG